MNYLTEVSLARRAQKYGELEPLLEYFVAHGLQDAHSRELVAQLARGKAIRRPGKPASARRDSRDDYIRHLVAALQGMLEGEGRSPLLAPGLVAKHINNTDGSPFGEKITQRQVKRIWEAKPPTGTELITRNTLRKLTKPDI